MVVNYVPYASSCTGIDVRHIWPLYVGRSSLISSCTCMFCGAVVRSQGARVPSRAQATVSTLGWRSLRSRGSWLRVRRWGVYIYHAHTYTCHAQDKVTLIIVVYLVLASPCVNSSFMHVLVIAKYCQLSLPIMTNVQLLLYYWEYTAV